MIPGALVEKNGTFHTVEYRRICTAKISALARALIYVRRVRSVRTWTTGPFNRNRVARKIHSRKRKRLLRFATRLVVDASLRTAIRNRPRTGARSCGSSPNNEHQKQQTDLIEIVSLPEPSSSLPLAVAQIPTVSWPLQDEFASRSSIWLRKQILSIPMPESSSTSFVPIRRLPPLLSRAEQLQHTGTLSLFSWRPTNTSQRWPFCLSLSHGLPGTPDRKRYQVVRYLRHHVSFSITNVCKLENIRLCVQCFE
jgi:hypothetical protein